LTIKLVVKRHKYKYLEFSGFLLEKLFVQEHNWAFPSRNKKKRAELGLSKEQLETQSDDEMEISRPSPLGLKP
jgi:hypothetical protein